MLTIYHNPRCSKSRQTLALLEERGLNPKIVKYLDTPPGVAELNAIITKLNIEPRALMRRNEAEYKELALNNTDLSAAELLQAMHDNPKLIERPIVVNNDKAAIGRPPEQVLDIL